MKIKNAFHYETHGNFLVVIKSDDEPENPREWDNVGTMACWHRRYNLGDIQPKTDVDCFLVELLSEFSVDLCENETYIKWLEENEWGDAETWLDELEDDELISALLEKYYYILPLYLYDHSGLTISTSSFSCPWDSGQVGFIYVSKEKAKREWRKLTGDEEEDRKTCLDYLRSEVKGYDNYLTGNVWGYEVYQLDNEQAEMDEDELEHLYTEDLEFKDSCWGFNGEWKECLKEAMVEVNGLIKEQEELFALEDKRMMGG